MPQVICPACMAAYDVPITALGSAGRRLRCASCKSLFLAPIPEDQPEAVSTGPTGDGADGFAAVEAGMADAVRQAPEPPLMRKARPLPWHQRLGAVARRPSMSRTPVAIALAFIVVLTGLTAFRRQIVATIPETGALFAALRLPVNLRGLELREIKSGIFNESAVDVLVVQGQIVNITGAAQPVPPLAFTVRDGKGQVLYSWIASADVTSLEPGARARFRRRLASPPVEGADVLVRFAPRPEGLALAAAKPPGK